MSSKKRSYIPEFVKPFLRLVRYSNERKKFLREIGIRRHQDFLLKEKYRKDTSKLIVFLIMGGDWPSGKDLISGGIISIVSICEETVSLQLPEAATVMCTGNGQHLLLKHEKFENNTDVFRFSQMEKYFTGLTSILIHLPEMMVEYFFSNLSASEKRWLKTIPSVQINIMNQNIKLMPGPSVLERLKGLTTEVTITTAHAQYCNRYYRDYYKVPIHKLSVWISPEGYHFTAWANKENLMVVSPDKHPMKDEILKTLAGAKGLAIQIIQNLTYTEYKKVISRAKWALTFGEGLDGYFIEPVFSGAMAFAVFNEDFFTADFRVLPGVFSSFEEMKVKLITLLQQIDNASDFTTNQQQQFELCARYYSKTQYRKNIAAFYNKQYTYA